MDICAELITFRSQPICGTIIGALVGCFVYDLMIFTGGGSYAPRTLLATPRVTDLGTFAAR